MAVIAAMAFVVETGGTAFAGPPPLAGPPKAPPAPAVKGVVAVPSHFTKASGADATAYVPAAVRWPAVGTSSFALAAPARGAALGVRQSAAAVFAQSVGAGPVRLDVQVYDHAAATAAGVSGVLLGVTAPTAGPVRVGLSYRDFASAYGGNYGSRLRLLTYPACVLTTPQVAACRVGTPLATTNDLAAQTVAATVTVPSGAVTGGVRLNRLIQPGAGRVVLAAGSDPGTDGGAAGTYAATDLKAEGSWTSGSSTGSFDYTYPLSLAQAPSSLLPKIDLGYDSSGPDGQTASTQAQSSWVGDGWTTPRSFIEQTFASCSDTPEGTAAPTKTGDMCYDGPIMTLSLNGASTSLVWDSSKSVWKPQNDDGAVVKHVTTGGDNGSGTYNHDYWTVTDRSGTVYSFGLNRLPGWATGKAATNSVDSEPVYSAHSGDPCYNATWSSSYCTMAYRWNLDYVKDVHDNAMAYYYAQDTNQYGRFNGAANVSYVRDSHLARIDYGFTDGNAYGTVPDQVVFGTGDRCVSGTCQPLNSTNKGNWPDVPFDLICASGSTCAAHSPSFFSTVRLSTITVQQWSTASSAYKTVDSYALTQTIPATGDGTSPTLWLSSITHTGSDLLGGGGGGVSITLPATTFASVKLPNRVDTVTDGLPAFYRQRIQTITTEAGAQINVNYGQPDPCTAPVTTAPASNTSSCYPLSWTPTGYADPFTDWMNKYVVTSVTQTDPTGGALAVSTSYTYLGGAAWHFDDNEVVKSKYRTYGQFRGYGDVKTYSGDGVNDRQTLNETTYYRGMSKDNNTTVVNLTDSQGGVHEDVNQLAGKPLEVTAYLGNGGPVDHATISSYWVSAPSATRARTGVADLTANVVGEAEKYTRQALTAVGGTTTWRYDEDDTTYDASTSSPTFGLAQRVYSHMVPVTAGYDKCVTTTYAAANTTANIAGKVSEVETLSVPCGGFTEGTHPSAPAGLNSLTAPVSVSRPAQVISDSRTFYDDVTWNTTFPQAAAPTKGDVTMVREASDYTAGAYVWQTTKRTKYDSVGRATDAYDGRGNDTKTAYTANAVGLTTAMQITNPLNQVVSSTLETGRGSTLTATDANGVVTTEQYDALGRLTAVWLNSRATTTPANMKFSYVISNSGTTSATTQRLNDELGYQTSTLIYDALLRPRQTQAMTPQGGRIVTDTFYDSRGWTSAKYAGWWDPATTPNTTLVSAANLHDSVPSADVFTMDGLGRTVIDQSEKDGVEVSRTTTVYNGDRTTVVPPAGGVVSTTRTDPLGRTLAVDRYTAAPTLNQPADTFLGIFTVSGGTTQSVLYGYDGHGRQNTVTQGTGGPVWTSTYDLLGNVTSKTDPDAGTTTGITYDGNDNVVQSTDARGRTTSLAYDALDRKIGQYASTVANQSSANQIAKWVYDNSDNAVPGMRYPIGHLTTSTSYAGGAAYVKQQKNFNIFGNSTGVTVTVPSTEGALAGSYTFQQTYSTTTGLALKDVFPAAGGLPAETVNHTYAGVLDMPDTLGGLTGYDQGTTYDAYGRVNQQTLGAAPNLAYVTNTYDPHTGAVVDRLLTRSTGTPTSVDDEAFSYDPAGNLVRQVSTRFGSASTSETQCFSYDQLNQLAAAWTASDSCAVAPTTASHAMVADNLGTSSAYWTSWGFDGLTDRASQVQHAFTGGPSTDITTAYTYDGNGAGQPHALTATGTTGGPTGTTAYGYDASGNMTSRNAGQGAQTLTWNDADQLTAITGGTGGNSSYVYDADGNILVQRDPGKVTVYLGTEQLTLDTATTTVSGSRYYGLPGGGQAVRTGTATNAYVFALSDTHSTPSLYLDATAQVPSWRQYTPFGAPRGAAVTAPDNHGFLGKPMDTNTGLTIVGARQYDPVTGRFVSDDPQFEADDPSQLNGYGYAANNPVVHEDPTGDSIWWGWSNLFSMIAYSPWLADGAAKLSSAVDSLNTATTNAAIHGLNHGQANRTFSSTLNRRTGEITTRASGKAGGGGRCCETNNAAAQGRSVGDPDLMNGKAKWWVADPEGEYQLKGPGGTSTAMSLEDKPVCTKCQGEWKSTSAAPDAPHDPGGAWPEDAPKVSRFTRFGTSMAEDALLGSGSATLKSAGSVLSKANGLMEGAAPALKAVGVVGIVASVGFDIYDIATAPPQQRNRMIAEDTGSLVGGLAFGAVGAAVAGPVGAVVLGYVGSVVGKAAGDLVADLFHW